MSRKRSPGTPIPDRPESTATSSGCAARACWEPDVSIELTTNPNLTSLYLKAAITATTRRGGDLPETVYTRSDIEIDREHLADYNRVCGFGLRDELPPTYPHMLSFGMQVRLMTDTGFPFALPGLVHIANTIRQQRPLLMTETAHQRVW